MSSLASRLASGRPPWPYRVNWDSPQAQGLELWVVTIGARAFEMRSQTVLTANGTITPRGSAVGVGADLPGSAWFNLAYDDAPFITELGFTIVWSGIIDTGSAFRHFAGKHATNGATNNPFDFRTSNAATPALSLARADAVGSRGHSGPSVVLGAYRTYAVRSADNLVETLPDFFVNGVKATGSHASGAATGAVTGGSQDIRIGQRADGTTVQLDGLVSEVRFYNRAISDGAIAAASEPATQWDLYWTPLQRRAFIDFGAGGGGGATFPALTVAY